MLINESNNFEVIFYSLRRAAGLARPRVLAPPPAHSRARRRAPQLATRTLPPKTSRRFALPPSSYGVTRSSSSIIVTCSAALTPFASSAGARISCS